MTIVRLEGGMMEKSRSFATFLSQCLDGLLWGLALTEA